MKVLVTGAGGFLGAVVVARLVAHGETDIRCLVRPGRERSKLQAIIDAHPGVHLEIVEGSLNARGCAAQALEGVDVVYHLAAGLRGSPADIFLNTVVASKNLLEAAVKRRLAKVVLVSSFGVYGVATLPRRTVVNEATPLETRPQARDVYSHAKLRQERLFWEYREKHGLPLVVLRPGVIYGPGGGPFSVRVGESVFGVFLHFGGGNILPLSYVENCADAIVIAGRSDASTGQVYNVHDDDLPTCRAYLRRYKREVARLFSIPVPYVLVMLLSIVIEWYHRWSKGQLPAAFTRYKTATLWKGNRFDNSKLKSLGWRQAVPTAEGMRRTFEHLRRQASSAAGPARS